MNKVILIGNLTRDPELRTTPNGVSVCSFSIAVNRRFANQQGERVTDFFNIITWRGLADNCGKFLAKGRRVAVVGELQTRSFDGRDGTKRYVTEVVADEVEFLSQAQRGEGGGGGASYAQQPATDSDSSSFADGFADVDDDELPF